MSQYIMFAIYPAPTNIYQLKQRLGSANINVGNVYQVVVEYKIAKSDM